MKRALVVIDVQNEYREGQFPITHPPLSESVPNIVAAWDAARAAGVPVIVVQHVDPEDSPVFARGSHGVELLPEIAGLPREHLVQKEYPSSFAGTGLDDWLRAHEIDTIAITGYMSQFCDESTARDGVHRGYAVELLADATGTLDLVNSAGRIGARELHESVLTALQGGFAAVTSTAGWIAAVEADEALPAPDLVASIRDAIA